MTTEELFNSALALHQAGRAREAEPIYRRVLSLDPAHSGALQALAILSYQAGRASEAISMLREAARINPGAADCQNNLGALLASEKQWADALAAFERAVSLGARFPQTFNNIGGALKELGRLNEAVSAYRTAISLRPDYADAHSNLASVLLEQGNVQEALEHGRRAVSLRSDLPEAQNSLGSALRALGDVDGAIDAFAKAAALRPDWPEVINNLGSVLQEARRLDEAVDCYRRALAIRNESRIWDNLLVAMQAQDSVTLEQIHREHVRWNELNARPLKPSLTRHVNPGPREGARRLRIGYVSPDFKEHPVGRQVLPVLANHDHAAFEVICYSDVRRPDEMTRRFTALADRWVDASNLNDQQLAQRAQEDGIDILVDLALHTIHNRMLVFARKPAAIQVTWAGYPGTTGLETMDYRLGDPHLDPPAENRDAFYSETTIRLPNCFWVFDAGSAAPAVGDLPAAGNRYITFGCLNNFSKITDETLRSRWAPVLRQVPNSRLVVLAPRGSARRGLAEVLASAGIHPDRIQFVDRRPRIDYLGTYNQIDICLDTYPYNGHMTTLDALWMGAPMVTMTGQSPFSRGGASILANAGLSDLVARDSRAFIDIAVSLAADLPRLAEVRSTLRQRMQASPLTDAVRFARDIEAAYRGMWQGR